MHYQPPTGMPLWQKAMIGCGLLMVVIIALTVWGVVAMVKSNAGSSLTSLLRGTPSAGVHVGSPFKWQTLQKGSNELLLVDLVSGDFDGDRRPEAIVYNSTPDINMRSMMSGNPNAFDPTLLTIFGDRNVQTTTKMMLSSPHPFGWDFDGDSHDELLTYSSGTVAGTDALNFNGRTIGHLDGVPDLLAFPLADIDGDGKRDLIVNDPAASGIIAYGKGGKVLWKQPLQAGSGEYNPAFGDVDGDGLAEMVLATPSFGGKKCTVSFSGLNQKRQEVAGWHGYFWPSSCADINGDGKDEVFASGAGYLDPASGKFTAFQYPGHYKFEDPSRIVLVCDLDGDKRHELVTGGNNYSMDSAVFIFDPNGTCEYYEEMGGTVEGKAIVRDGAGHDHLVVLTENRLLQYP